jgi:hypothetical protein
MVQRVALILGMPPLLSFNQMLVMTRSANIALLVVVRSANIT